MNSLIFFGNDYSMTFQLWLCREVILQQNYWTLNHVWKLNKWLNFRIYKTTTDLTDYMDSAAYYSG